MCGEWERRIILEITIDENSHVLDGKLTIPEAIEKKTPSNGSGFDELVKKSVGQHWNSLVGDEETVFFIVIGDQCALLYLLDQAVQHGDRAAEAKVHDRFPGGGQIAHSISKFRCGRFEAPDGLSARSDRGRRLRTRRWRR